MNSPGKYTIVVVEDDPALSQLVQTQLKKSGFMTLSARSASEAMEVLLSGGNLIALIDYRLSDCTGAQLIKQLEAAGRKVPFIVMTAHGDEETALEVMRLGAFDYIKKDLGFTQNLMTVLTKLIAQLQLQQELLLSQAEISHREEKYRAIFENIQDVYFEVDLSGVMLEISPSVEPVFGYTRDQLIGNRITNGVISQKDFDSISKKLETNAIIRDFELQIKDKNRNDHYCAITCRLMKKSATAKTKVIGIIRDITERKQQESAMTNMIIETEERDKKQFAEDLHDSIGPQLSALKLFLNVLVSEERNIEEKEEILLSAREIIDQLIGSVRLMANNLSPNVLNDFGLVKAIESFLSKIGMTQTCHFKFQHNLVTRFPKNTEILLYRTIAELVNNTIKHAEATQVSIELLHQNGDVNLEYSDNGKGFDTSNIGNPGVISGHGINNIIARIRSLNGQCNFTSLPDQGLTVRISLSISLKSDL